MDLRNLVIQKDSRIAALDAMITELQAEREQLRSEVANHHYHLSPLARIPPEILGKIFLACLPRSDEVMDRLETEADEFWSPYGWPPFVLDRICKTWRHVALGMRELWSSPFVNASTSRNKIDVRSSFLRTWLERSGDHPLTIVVMFYSDAKYVSEDIVHLLRLQSSRWRSIELIDPPGFFIRDLLQDLLAPLLERFEAKNNQWLVSSQKTELKLLQSAVHLKEVHVVGLEIDMTALKLPWSQLTVLHLQDWPRVECPLTWEVALDILSRSLRLVELGISPSVGDISSPTHVKTAVLRSLSIISPLDCTNFLERLTLPSLSALRIGTKDYRLVPWPGKGLRRLFKRSACNITELTLVNFDFSEKTLIRFLHEVPQLQVFTLMERRYPALVGPNMFNALNATKKGVETLLPSLARLKMTAIQHVTASQIANVVESRGWLPQPQCSVQGAVRIQFVDLRMNLKHNPIPDEGGMARLRACRGAGLNIRCKWDSLVAKGVSL